MATTTDNEHEQAPREEEVVSVSGSEAPSDEIASAQLIAGATVGATTGNASGSELAALRGKRDDLVATLEARGGHSVVLGSALTVDQLAAALVQVLTGPGAPAPAPTPVSTTPTMGDVTNGALSHTVIKRNFTGSEFN